MYKRLVDEPLIASALELQNKMSPQSELTANVWCSQERTPLGILEQACLIQETKLRETFYRHSGEEWGFKLTTSGQALVVQHKDDDAIRDAVIQRLWPTVLSASLDWMSSMSQAYRHKGWTTWRG